MKNELNEQYFDLLSKYLESYPYEGKLYFSYFASLVKDNPRYDFDDFEMWFMENQDSTEIKGLFNKLDTTIKELIIKSDKEFLIERKRTKLLFPSVESLYTPVGMFDN